MKARGVAWLVVAAVVVGLIVLAFITGRGAGSDHVTAEAQKDHGARVAEARSDERTAATSTATIAARTARADALSDRLVRQTIEDLRNAISQVPPARGGDPVPAAPVDSVRASLNAGIDRANRAAGPASAAH
ncbi:hypothetical protein NS355_02305 [Sphingomonas yabuuchiae]|uniref:Uncharacterized protein n=1 Tax=Sphingomonas yabuuchiae TaxID=172044 RepID=A0A147IYX5_9SPHN|nr:hypothetical protein [Sphingomonas yabuuchiae]KTW01040.1 hypothetical protein NS355_02305 [Sphingomonas yabuuchiae]